MTTPDVEQRLHDAMRAHAEAVPTSGEWEHVRQRAAFAHRRRRIQRVGLTVLTAAAAVLLVVIALPGLRSDPSQPLETGPAQPGPDTTATHGPGPEASAPPPLYVSSADDPADAAIEFAEVYLGMTEVFASEPAVGHDTEGTESAMVAIRAWEQGPVTRVDLRRPGDGWGVIGASTDNIVLDSPRPDEQIAAPVRLRGEARAFEGTVHVEIRQHGMLAGQALGTGFVTGSGGPELGPFDGEIAFDTPTQPWGAIVLVNSSAEDGSPLEATVVRVAFAGVEESSLWGDRPIYAITAAGIERWTEAGGLVRREILVGEEHLGQGADDLAVSPDGSVLFYVRAVTGCLREIVTVRLDGGSAATPEVVAAGTAPAPSPDGRLLAHAVDEDCDGHDELVVRDLATGAVVHRWGDARSRFDPWSRVASISWSPGGDRLAYALQSEHVAEVRVLDIGGAATSVLDGRELAPDRLGRADTDVVDWVAPRFHPTQDVLFVVEECCDVNERSEHRLLVVNIEGQVIERWPQLPSRVRRLSPGDDRVLVVTDDGTFIQGRHGQIELTRAGVTDATW